MLISPPGLGSATAPIHETLVTMIIGSKNYYDIRKPCVGSLCYDFSNMEKFLNLKSVRESLAVGDREFVSCSPTVYEAMLLDWMRNLEVGIPELLENDIKVLIYAGEYDLICNWLGNSRWVNSMEWSGKEAFVSSSEKPFTVDGKEAGVLKSYGGGLQETFQTHLQAFRGSILPYNPHAPIRRPEEHGFPVN